MTDHSSLNDVTGWRIATWVLGLLTPFLGWLGLRHIGRIDRHSAALKELEATKVPFEICNRHMDQINEQHTSSIARLEDALKDHREETRLSFLRVFERLDKIVDSRKWGEP